MGNISWSNRLGNDYVITEDDLTDIKFPPLKKVSLKFEDCNIILLIDFQANISFSGKR